MAQLRGAPKSGCGTFSQLYISGFHDGEAEAGRARRFSDFIRLGGRIPGGSVVAHGVEVSTMRKSIWTPAVDAALHQLRAKQG